VPVNAEITFLLFKEQRPFKLKKEHPSEQWQIISFRLIPLKTPVSFHWTVPLSQTDRKQYNKSNKTGSATFKIEGFKEIEYVSQPQNDSDVLQSLQNIIA
jgi:hypothetical protein